MKIEINIVSVIEHQLNESDMVDLVVEIERLLSLENTAKLFSHFMYIADYYKEELRNFDLTPKKHNT